ncbi:MAG: hypothetical protein EBT41_06430 [Betaproteobacteria bacterium]|nr:hypothetical protein [Betaproteobacteria bacterium]
MHDKKERPRHFIGLIIAFFSGLTAPVLASESLRPDALVALAIENNPDLLLSRADLVSAKAAQSLTGVLQNPRVEFGLGRESSQAILQDRSAQLQNLSLSQFVENPALRESRIASARFLSQAQAARLQWIRAQVAGLVRRSAYEVVLRQAEIKAADEARLLLEYPGRKARARASEDPTAATPRR